MTDEPHMDRTPSAAPALRALAGLAVFAGLVALLSSGDALHQGVGIALFALGAALAAAAEVGRVLRQRLH